MMTAISHHKPVNASDPNHFKDEYTHSSSTSQFQNKLVRQPTALRDTGVILIEIPGFSRAYNEIGDSFSSFLSIQFLRIVLKDRRQKVYLKVLQLSNIRSDVLFQKLLILLLRI